MTTGRSAPDRAAGLPLVDPVPLWPNRMGPPPGSAPLVELPARDSGYYAPDRTWVGDEITESLLQSLLGSAVIIGAEHIAAKPWALVAVFDLGRGTGPEVYLYSSSSNIREWTQVPIEQIRSLATVRYLGHQDDVLPAR